VKDEKVWELVSPLSHGPKSISSVVSALQTSADTASAVRDTNLSALNTFDITTPSNSGSEPR
jgi:hypothetical protein